MAARKFTIDHLSWDGGMAPSDRGALPGQYSPRSVGVDIFRSFGAVGPGFWPHEIQSTVVTDLIKWFQPGLGSAADDYQYLYGHGDAGRIYRISQVTGEPALVRAIPSYSGSAEGLEPYTQSGTPYLFYAMATDIGRSGSDWTQSYTDNYWTFILGQPALTAGVPHPLKRFLSNLYVADKNVLHEINGTTVTLNKLQLPPNQVIVQTEVTETEIACLTRTVANGTFAGDSRIYFWDGVAGTYTHRAILGENSAPCLINAGGILYLPVGTGVKRLTRYNGSGLEGLAAFPASLLPVPGGIAAKDGLLYFLCGGEDYQGKVLTYGSPFPEAPSTINQPLRTAYGNANQAVGALAAIASSKLIGSYFDGTRYLLYLWSQNYAPNCQFATGVHNGLTADMKSYRNFKCYFSQLQTDESLKLSYAADGGAITDFASGHPSYSGYATWNDYGAATWAEKAAVKWSDLGKALSVWQVPQSVHAHEFQFFVTFFPSSDNQYAPSLIRIEGEYEPVSE